MPAETPTHVIDANVVAAWSLDRPWSKIAAEFRVSEIWLLAPDIIVHEVGNVLWLNVQAGVLDRRQAIKSYSAVTAFIELVSGVNLRYDALELAIDLGHPIYDCFYLALARQSGLPLVTADQKLVSRAGTAGVKTINLA